MCGILCLAKKCCIFYNSLTAKFLVAWGVLSRRDATELVKYISYLMCDALERTHDAQHRLERRKLWATILTCFEIGVACNNIRPYLKQRNHSRTRVRSVESSSKGILIISYVSVQFSPIFWQKSLHIFVPFCLLFWMRRHKHSLSLSGVAWEWEKSQQGYHQVKTGRDTSEHTLRTPWPQVPIQFTEKIPVRILFGQPSYT